MVSIISLVAPNIASRNLTHCILCSKVFVRIYINEHINLKN